MNYLFYIILSISAAGIIFVPLWFKYKLKKDFFIKQSISKILAKNPEFFSTKIVSDSVLIGLKHHKTPILEQLIKGNINKVAQSESKYNKISPYLLKSFEKPQVGINFLEKHLKKNPADNDAFVWLALLLEKSNKPKAAAAWDNVNENKLSKYLKAHYLTHMSDIAAQNGDLEFASDLQYKAARLFAREQAFYEEGQVYLKLGTLYRICFIDDTAEALLRSAIKLFKQIKYERGVAQGHANLGMLMISQERFEEAHSLLQKAYEYYQKQEDLSSQAEIENQLALLYLVQKQTKAALKFLKQAEKNHLQSQNRQGLAFSQELMANTYWQEGQYTQTAKFAQKAAQIYKQEENVSGRLESLYLQAQALVKQEENEKAEDILRSIIEQGKKNSGCFYLANAYTLLGIIYMRRKDLLRAKGLFRQSLELEQRGTRTKALAADYANIGLVELCCGHKETAQKNIETALDLACQIEDEELCLNLRQHLAKINNSSQ